MLITVQRIEDMRFGLNVINAWSPDFILQLAVAAEEAGWDGFFLWDHVTFEYDVSLHDPWILLGAIAACTKKIRLGTLVTPLARRRPHIVAKETATLDHLSKGRVVLGVGLGGVDREFSAFGEESDSKKRAEKLDEAIELIRKIWSGEVVEHDGKHYTLDRVALLPKPIQEPQIPIWVGGHSKPALRRASKYDGWADGGPAPSVELPGMTSQELKASITYIKKNREEKNPIDIVYTAELPEDSQQLRDMIRKLQQIGITWVLESIHGMRYSDKKALERVKRGPPEIN
ncbi:MAG: TIGR03619 family F420-dependent LLM class oxidoreductase [Candidatus Bathyarchaeota archaeon]|nr:TIGR03619 family F420-dependent LLM class oxidoreductase [Candidatus Bathyarchaeota archaeon]